MNKTNKHIVLIGFMGTGKTTVGIRLAKKLNLNHTDTDKVIEIKERLSISDIFSKKGEKYFREIETDLLNSLINSEIPLVISTGGGIVLSEQNRVAMRDSLVILLQATPEEIYDRIKEDESRPLLDKEDSLLSQIKSLSNERNKLYEQTSDLTIETGDKDVEEIVREISKYLDTIHKD